jgi:hypothetical protein
MDDWTTVCLVGNPKSFRLTMPGAAGYRFACQRHLEKAVLGEDSSERAAGVSGNHSSFIRVNGVRRALPSGGVWVLGASLLFQCWRRS